jgi:hypothetical protein
MIGRREFSTAGLSAAAWVALQASGVADDAKKPAEKHSHHDAHNTAFLECSKACSDCQRECDACAVHCTQELAAGNKDHMATQATCLDCANFCAAAAQISARGGTFADLICESCAEACSRCAAACEKLPDDERMKECARQCRHCEAACRKMLAAIGEGKAPRRA